MAKQDIKYTKQEVMKIIEIIINTILITKFFNWTPETRKEEFKKGVLEQASEYLDIIAYKRKNKI